MGLAEVARKRRMVRHFTQAAHLPSFSMHIILLRTPSRPQISLLLISRPMANQYGTYWHNFSWHS